MEDAPAIQNVFEDQRINEVEKIDQRDFLVISNKPSLISYIEFVIPDEFKDVKIKVFLFINVVEELVQVSNIQNLILQYFKIRGRVFSNWGRRIWCEQVSISIFQNLKDKIHHKGEGNVMNRVLDKLFEFSLVIRVVGNPLSFFVISSSFMFLLLSFFCTF